MQALDVPAAVADSVEWAEWERGVAADGEIRLIAVGKAAHSMVEGIVSAMPRSVRIRGVICAPEAPPKPLSSLTYYRGGHPVPNQQSLDGAQAALDLLAGAAVDTLTVVLLSGGGSALLEKSLVPSATLAEIQELNRTLVTCGASISEINTVRKHFSAVKGGRLTAAAYPGQVLTLAISDVPVGQESALASGPTLPDPTTREDVDRVLEKYELRPRIPGCFCEWMDSGRMPETPKPGDIAFMRAQFRLVLGMHELFHAAHRVAEAEDCVAFCDNSTDDWRVEDAAGALLAQLDQLVAANPDKNVALIADGEVSSAVTGKGIGGRNSAFVLACVERIAGKNIVVLSAGTDGIDGNSPAAGAVADGQTLQRAIRAGMKCEDYFRGSDSFRFFNALGDAVVTGPTGNNLRDLRLLLYLPR
jgi:hydroxypyruvate reductase